MSLKPPKKSDLDKSWINPRRDSHKKIQPEYHLIYQNSFSPKYIYRQEIL